MFISKIDFHGSHGDNEIVVRIRFSCESRRRRMPRSLIFRAREKCVSLFMYFCIFIMLSCSLFAMSDRVIFSVFSPCLSEGLHFWNKFKYVPLS